MPEITVSEELHRKLQAAGETEGDLDTALWKMVGSYRRETHPEADTR